MSMRVMVIDDEEIKRVSLVDDLRDAELDVVDFAAGEPALDYLRKNHVDVVVTDLKMPGISGLDVVAKLRKLAPEADAVVMTAFGTVETAVEAMRHGAYDYISKPFSSDQLIVLLERLAEERRLRKDNAALRLEARGDGSDTETFVAESPAMARLLHQIHQVAQSDSHILLTGETGSGKDELTKKIHALSPRRDRPFVKITCATYTHQLLESELYGHERGAYTGADKAQPGRFELAHEGTVYLDDVDDIPLEAQTRLLRVIEERVIERVGGTRLIPIDVRIIASTKADLKKMVDAGEFRSDLFYRLNVMQLAVPPLRDRPEDIEPLIHHFCANGSATCLCRFDEDVLSALRSYCWPGNIRELRNLVDRWKLLNRTGDITREDLPPEFLNFGDIRGNACEACPRTFEESVEALERRLLADALGNAAGNKSQAADLLGLKSSTLRNKLAKYDMNGEPPSANSGA
jgi:DNA-binding NtrC family response regulator